MQITTKGSVSELSTNLPQIGEFASLAESTLLAQEPTAESRPSTEPELGAESSPVIKVTNSTTDNISALFQSSWGRAPRSLEDVSKALETNGVPDSDPAVGSVLLRLVKKGELRRIKKGDKWQYFRIPH